MGINTQSQTFTPTIDDIRLAKQSGESVSTLLKRTDDNKTIRLDAPFEIPALAIHVLSDILDKLSAGQTITVIPTDSELTTQQAADLLRVSRPFLIGLLEDGEIPYRRVGTHRRIRTTDLLNYKRKADEISRQAVKEMTELAQELGIY